MSKRRGVFDVRKSANDTLNEIAFSWRNAEEKVAARFREEYPEATDAD